MPKKRAMDMQTNRGELPDREELRVHTQEILPNGQCVLRRGLPVGEQPASLVHISGNLGQSRLDLAGR